MLIAKEKFYHHIVNNAIEQAIHWQMTVNEHKNTMVDMVNQKIERLSTALQIATDEETKRAYKISGEDHFEVFLSNQSFPNSQII